MKKLFYLLFVCSVVFVGCDAAAVDKEIELLKKENKESSENDYKTIIDSLKEWNKGGNAGKWLVDIVKNENINFKQFMTKKCADYAEELSSANTGYVEFSNDDLVRKYGNDFDLNFANWIHPFFSGQDTYGDTYINSLKFLGMFNNGLWFQVESSNPKGGDKVIRLVKIIEGEKGYQVDNFLSLSDF